MGSLRLSYCLYTHKTVLGKRGNALRFNKRLRMGNYREACTLLIPIQARAVVLPLDGNSATRDSVSSLMRSENHVEWRGGVEVIQTSPKIRGNVLGLAQKTLLSVQVTYMGTIYTTLPSNEYQCRTNHHHP